MRVKRILRCISASNCTIFFSCSAGIVDFYVWWWFSGGMGLIAIIIVGFILGIISSVVLNSLK